jgi:hypothetical protein
MGCCQHSHKKPALPLTCNIWRAAAGPPNPPLLTVNCQLLWSASHLAIAVVPGTVNTAFLRFLYLPSGTDLRPTQMPNPGDVVEVPAGSGRFYTCVALDDVAKGFPNEFRLGVLQPQGNWPFPIP